jgi:Type III restriction enzyme, res subunit
MPQRTNYTAFLESFRSQKFRALRPAQSAVLDAYNNFLEKSDVGIELPTGAGKTLIALLICEFWRRENRKVAVLSANKTLARQMVAEAAALGAPAVLMEGPGRDIPGADKRAYHRANSIAVMNYWVYFNQNPVLDPADLLVMDDAHLGEHCLHSLYRALDPKKQVIMKSRMPNGTSKSSRARHFGIGVTAKKEEDRNKVRDILKSHNGHFVTFCGRWVMENLEP